MKKEPYPNRHDSFVEIGMDAEAHITTVIARSAAMKQSPAGIASLMLAMTTAITAAGGQPYAATSKSSSPATGPESCPLALTSRSTNSMIAMGDASDARMPALMMRV